MSTLDYDIEQAVARLRTIEPDPTKAAEWIKAATLLAASGASPELAAVVANIASRGRLCADDIAQLGRHQIDLKPALDAIRRQS